MRPARRPGAASARRARVDRAVRKVLRCIAARSGAADAREQTRWNRPAVLPPREGRSDVFRYSGSDVGGPSRLPAWAGDRFGENRSPNGTRSGEVESIEV